MRLCWSPRALSGAIVVAAVLLVSPAGPPSSIGSVASADAHLSAPGSGQAVPGQIEPGRALVGRAETGHRRGEQALGATLSVVWIVPFALMLLSIAILPLAAGHWWDHLGNKAMLAVALAAPVAGFFLARQPHELVQVAGEYLAFIALLGSLFVIAGGILLRGDLRATPGVNTAFLAIGAVLANLVGTTGASMLLIRPLLETNSERRRISHIPIFFIFLVSNIGGCLTPLGDPPLFLGFLEGVPFAWTLRLFPEWAFMVILLLVIFYAVDSRAIRHEAKAALRLDRERVRPLRMRGAHNFLFLLGVLLAVLLVRAEVPRVLLMAAMGVASFLTTRREIHRGNRFSFYPISEVAIVFAGIFVTMVPALLILEARGASLGIDRPWQFFWLSGGLSSFLDNAPTYLTFSRLALGVAGLAPEPPGPLSVLVHHEAGAALLRSISLGAVFMGANTYIGNGPNFMVKTIVEHRKIRMPSFFGYMLWSGGILVPLFLLVTIMFLI
jgi:Na+/H+ antiporter NhaD/arsenite permease-like protein